jgi:tRNA(Ile2) C34 agmatinyltransferase TiaS
MENTLVRSSRCPECHGEMMWTQNSWKAGDSAQAAYSCQNGHVVAPSVTPQCPACGIHDTVLLSAEGGREHFRCTRCTEAFQLPR